MQAAGIDLLLLTTEPEFRYFSGFLSPFWQSPTRPWFLLLPASGKPVAVIPSIGESALAASWIDDIRCWPSPQPHDEGISLLLATINELAGKQPVIGIPMGAETHLRLPLADWAKIRARLPDEQWRDATPICLGLRQIKSSAEIDKIRWLCQTVSGVFEQFPRQLTPGISVAEAFRAFKIDCLHAGVDEVSYLVGDAAPGGYDDIISPPRHSAIQRGDVLMLDTGCTFDGYFCDFDRNYSFGEPSAATRDAQHRLWDATEAAFDAIRPGVSCLEVFAVMQRTLGNQPVAGESRGEVGRFGHGLGMQLTETPSFAAFDTTPLAENMVMTLEPSLAFATGKMLVHEENIVITANGAEWLSRRAPRELPIIDGF